VRFITRNIQLQDGVPRFFKDFAGQLARKRLILISN
jgi:hypothetical protein